MDLILRQARCFDYEHPVDIGIKDGTIVKIDRSLAKEAPKEIDVKGKLVAPPFVESHVHLDSALTLGRPRLNESGTLLEGIQIWGEYKENISKRKIKEKAKETLSWLITQGILRIRTHIDTTEPQLKTIKALLEIRKEMKDFIDIQIVAFPQDGLFTDEGLEELLEKAIHLGTDVIGGIPQVEFTREDGILQIERIFQLAKKHNKMIDIHTDETTDEHSRFTEVIAKYTIKYKMQNRVTASHTTAMHNYNNDYAQKLIANLKRAQVNVVTNPFSNAMLQNRLDGYPKNRGTTRIAELLEAGVNVGIGNDNIMDPFNPLGKGNLLQAAHLLAHTAHLSNPKGLRQLFQMMTTHGAKIFQDESYGIKIGNPADLIVLNAKDEAEAIRLTSDCLYVIRRGKIISQTIPAKHELNLSGKRYHINFKC